MKIIYKEPVDKSLKLMEVEYGLQSLQELVGGHFQVINIRFDVYCLFDKNAMFKELENNFYHHRYGWIQGNVVFCSIGGGSFNSLNEEQIRYVAKYIGFPLEIV